MFYPVDSLRRGGRFYLCWVADSWPLRFATITHRQLWSQDIRKICDDLLEVMTNESGRPTKRFSLRLSSQILRGLVRLYERKVSIFLGELCMIHANVFKHTNKKYHVLDVVDVTEQARRPRLQHLQVEPVFQEQPENEPRVEELIQASGNMVAHVEDITLKEPVIAELPLPYDGFGEENPEQILQNLQDRTLEMMLVQQPDVTTHSAAEITMEKSYDKSKDKSRTVLDPQMETISEMDVTLFRKSVGDQLIPEFEKDIPEIPEIPPLVIPAPEVEQIQEQPAAELIQETVEQPAKPPTPEEFVLEELEEGEPRGRKRKAKKLIVDKKIKLDTKYCRARIENNLVECRCENFSDDIVFIGVPVDTYFKRLCHGGFSIRSNVGFVVSRLFQRNLGIVPGHQTFEEREMEEAIIHQSSRGRGLSVLERIDEEQEPIQEVPQIEVQRPSIDKTREIPDIQLERPSIDTAQQNVTEARISVEPMDIAEMLTQKIETLSQERKRLAETEAVIEPKRQRSMGYVAFRESQKSKTDVIIPDFEADKENIPQNLQTDNIQPQYIEPSELPQLSRDPEIIVSSLLQEVGLADIQPPIASSQMQESQRAKQSVARKSDSEGSEPLLGSLDRTKVSLGDSEHTTDSHKFIRDQWGTEGTMIKILRFIKAKQTVTVESLIAKGPVLTGHRRIIAARCFSSILKLQHHRFVNICKDPETLEIRDVTFGSKLARLNEED